MLEANKEETETSHYTGQQPTASDTNGTQTIQNDQAQAVGSTEPQMSERMDVETRQQCSNDVAQQSNGLGTTTIWMGDLEPWMNENIIASIFHTNLKEPILRVKMIYDRYSGFNAGYCFLEFSDEVSDKYLIEKYHNKFIPEWNKNLNLNYARTQGSNTATSNEQKRGFSLYVGDLARNICENDLLQLFKEFEPISARILVNSATGESRGFGFVRFSNEKNQADAMQSLQGREINGKPIRIAIATDKHSHLSQNFQQQHSSRAPFAPQSYPAYAFYSNPQPLNQFTDPNNTTIFIGGLPPYIRPDDLRQFFSSFGEIAYVKIPQNKGCGFIQFVERYAAEMAIARMHGFTLNNHRLRLSWGRSHYNTPSYQPNGPPLFVANPATLPGNNTGPPQHHFSPLAPINPYAAHMTGHAPPPPIQFQTNPTMSPGNSLGGVAKSSQFVQGIEDNVLAASSRPVYPNQYSQGETRTEE